MPNSYGSRLPGIKKAAQRLNQTTRDYWIYHRPLVGEYQYVAGLTTEKLLDYWFESTFDEKFGDSKLFKAIRYELRIRELL